MAVDSEAVLRQAPYPFQRAVTQFAEGMRLDAQLLIDGQALEYEGRRFWLVHYGEDDPDGLTVMMETCDVEDDPEWQVAATTPLLECMTASPVSLAGYYGFLPQHNCLVACRRIALDEEKDGAMALASTIAQWTGLMDAVDDEVHRPESASPVVITRSGGMQEVAP